MSAVSSLKLVSCNIEGRKHYQRLIPFIQAQQPEVICLQEVFECDLGYLSEQFGMPVAFTPILDSDFKNIFDIDPLGYWGIAIFTSLPVVAQGEHYYVGERSRIPKVDESNSNSLNRAVRWADVKKDDQVFRVATTHFTWSPNGNYIPLQGENLQSMEQFLKAELEQFVLCGDFNSPRGGEIYHRLTKWLTDHLPPEIKTTIDKNWHRAGDLQFVVDYIFSTQSYRVENVQVNDGVSDHMAVSGTIIKQ